MKTNVQKFKWYYILLLFIFVLIIDFCYSKYSNSNGIIDTVTIISNFQAKQICSCLFVEQNKEDYCQKWVAANYLILPLEIDGRAKTVSSKLGNKIYYYKNSRNGCAQK